MPIEYAHALERSLEDKTKPAEIEARVDRFLKIVQHHGKRRALPAIIREWKRLQERKKAQQPTLFIARAKDEDTARSQLRERLPNAPADVAIHEAPSLIGGWRYLQHDTLIDTSYKAALLALYRKFTSH